MKKLIAGLLLSLMMGCSQATIKPDYPLVSAIPEAPVVIFSLETFEVEQTICGLRRGDYYVNEVLAQKVAEKVKEMLVIANKAYPDYYFDFPYLSFDIPTDSLSAAGRYDDVTRTMLINPLYLNRFGEAFIEEVIPHEVAHLVARDMGSREMGHGKDWYAVMTQVFKVKNPKPNHDYLLCDKDPNEN